MSKLSHIPLYHFPASPEQSLPFIITQINSMESITWDTTPDRHSFYMLFWLTGGRGYHHIDFKSYPILAQRLYLLSPGQTHFFQVSAPLTGYTLLFTEDLLRLHQHPPTAESNLELFYPLNQCPILDLTPKQTSLLTPLIKQLHTEYQNQQYGHLPAIQHLLQLLLIYVRRFYGQLNIPTRPTAAVYLTSQFQRLVDEHFLTIHHLNDYADILGVTPGHLSDAVKTIVGVPASQVIRQRLLLEAKRLLVYSHLNTLEISTHIGFKDSSYFCRFFKRETNFTPLTFRTIYREKYHPVPV